MNKIVIGIDQSFTRTGICVMQNKKIIKVISLDFKGCKTNTEKRALIKKELCSFMWSLGNDNNSERICIVERTRLYSQNFISMDYIKASSSLIATIIDTMSLAGIPVYSVDTKSWKNNVVGNSKPKENKYGIPAEKYPTICYLRSKGLLHYIAYEYKGKGRKGVIQAHRASGEVIQIKVNDDLADAICIAMYGFLPEHKQKLKEEKF